MLHGRTQKPYVSVIVSQIKHQMKDCIFAEQSPSDYLLYYKRATAYLSLNRHSNALDDCNTVLRLTSGTFGKAMLMKARVYAREGNWVEAKKLAKAYTKQNGNGDKEALDLVRHKCCVLHNVLTGTTCSYFPSRRVRLLPRKPNPPPTAKSMMNVSSKLRMP
jgi:hypothetical protein